MRDAAVTDPVLDVEPTQAAGLQVGHLRKAEEEDVVLAPELSLAHEVGLDPKNLLSHRAGDHDVVEARVLAELQKVPDPLRGEADQPEAKAEGAFEGKPFEALAKLPQQVGTRLRGLLLRIRRPGLDEQVVPHHPQDRRRIFIPPRGPQLELLDRPVAVPREEALELAQEVARFRLPLQLCEGPLRRLTRQDLAHAWAAPGFPGEGPDAAAHLRRKHARRARAEQDLRIGSEVGSPAPDQPPEQAHPGQEAKAHDVHDQGHVPDGVEESRKEPEPAQRVLGAEGFILFDLLAEPPETLQGVVRQ